MSQRINCEGRPRGKRRKIPHSKIVGKRDGSSLVRVPGDTHPAQDQRGGGGELGERGRRRVWLEEGHGEIEMGGIWEDDRGEIGVVLLGVIIADVLTGKMEDVYRSGRSSGLCIVLILMFGMDEEEVTIGKFFVGDVPGKLGLFRVVKDSPFSTVHIL